ncbi:lactase/phlorizin hydrolase isoform X6 [Hemicordylus capensis]|uniref:lactase/phlorizin hydrolase isoform X6 n=1 Tax=Hemicordylus capensis TaxID=884348 RepID=UPI002304BFB6|nr:lactase/phlorizin hydrolase isoform X6 [Hemicordylus capensis]
MKVLLFGLNFNECSSRRENRFATVASIFSAIRKDQSFAIGYDVNDFLDNSSDKAVWLYTQNLAIQLKPKEAQQSVVAPLSSYQMIWETFANQSESERDIFLHDVFPSGFLWGTSTGSFNVEGGWAEDGKGESIWDRFGHEGHVHMKQTADVACDSYHKIEYDTYLLRGLQPNIYKFSISWPRIFHNGSKDSLNPQGVDYYNKLIDTLLDSNIEPMVTLFHWDLPQALQDLGGWQNESIINAFVDYASFCFATFGDRVKFWITFHEPWVISYAGYGTGQHPPGIADPGEASYQVAHVILKAHARAWHVYDIHYRPKQHGKVGIVLNSDWAEPKSPGSPDDVRAAELYLQFMLGWFAHPIFVNGDYPDILKSQIKQKNQECSTPIAKLPMFSDDEKLLLNGTADFFGLSHYTSRYISASINHSCTPSYENIGDFSQHVDPSWPQTPAPWLYVVPWGLRRLLRFVSQEYTGSRLPIYIAGNGAPTDDGGDLINDTTRLDYYRLYINEALKAYNLDGVNLRGFVAWSFMDNFEWLSGYDPRFGLHQVDFDNPNRPRTPKRSAIYFAEIIHQNGLPQPKEEEFLYGKFPENFYWSVASAAYQIEGAWRADGKGLSIWDQFAHTPLKISNDENGDIACDSYHKMEADLAILKELKVTHYRFSISWPRILPDGTTQHINEAGLKYYERLVDALLAANIQPQVTMYHWDLPQALQNTGGWENETIIQTFKDYAELLFQRLGEKVKFWITLNEPYSISNIGHGYGVSAPGISARPGRAPYIVGHNLIKAHAEVWHLYNETYRSKQGGLISLAISAEWAEPKNPYKQEDIDAARRHVQFFAGWFAHPIFKNGDYSEVMKQRIRERSQGQSRLPVFTESEKQRIKGTFDFFGLNHYTTILASNLNYPALITSYDADRGVASITDRSWLGSGSFWLKVTPFGFRRLLKWIKEEYNNPPIYVTENGISERVDGGFHDIWRIHYLKNYINEALKGVVLDGIDLRGYTVWSLMDNFEWAVGFAERFGLYFTNYTDPNLSRIPKESSKYYTSIIRCNGFPDPASGPHLCLDPQPESTGGTPAPTSSAIWPTHDATTEKVEFLGLNLTSSHAEVALYVMFALLLVAVLGLAIFSCVYRKVAKKAHNQFLN